MTGSESKPYKKYIKEENKIVLKWIPNSIDKETIEPFNMYFVKEEDDYHYFTNDAGVWIWRIEALLRGDYIRIEPEDNGE